METLASLSGVYSGNCPTHKVLDLISDRWTVLVIGLLEQKSLRFSELQRHIGGISQKMLSHTLRQLERDGLVTRTVYAQVPPKVEYALTPLGQTLCEPLAAIRQWAELHIDHIAEAQALYENRRLAEEK
jgi:DNA-binding HxlR family transcriptional regulator